MRLREEVLLVLGCVVLALLLPALQSSSGSTRRVVDVNMQAPHSSSTLSMPALGLGVWKGWLYCLAWASADTKRRLERTSAHRLCMRPSSWAIATLTARLTMATRLRWASVSAVSVVVVAVCSSSFVRLGIKKAVSEGVCTREELWITSKLWNTYHRAEHVPLALQRTLADLQVGVLLECALALSWLLVPRLV
jgi:hypothetical protein